MVDFGDNTLGQLLLSKLMKINYENQSIYIKALMNEQVVWEIIEDDYIEVDLTLQGLQRHILRHLKRKKLRTRVFSACSIKQ
jgi:hypothetical protein